VQVFLFKSPAKCSRGPHKTKVLKGRGAILSQANEREKTSSSKTNKNCDEETVREERDSGGLPACHLQTKKEKYVGTSF